MTGTVQFQTFEKNNPGATLSHITFVYIGSRLPKYATSSLSLAKKYSGLEVRLIANQEALDHMRHSDYETVAVENFYDDSDFKGALRFLDSDVSFRDGLWAKSLERFFVLNQYMRAYHQQSVLHAELDQFLFRIDRLQDASNSLNQRGVFVPVYNSTTVIASVFYCNQIEALDSLISFSKKGIPFNNEMELIAKWASSFPNYVFEFPSLSSVALKKNQSMISGVGMINPIEVGGIVDPAQLGQWVAGIDPRNVPWRQKPKSKYSTAAFPSDLNSSDLQEVKFDFDDSTFEVSVSYRDLKLRLYNLHIHSKIHSRKFESTRTFVDFFESANLPEPRTFPRTRVIQLLDFVLSNLHFIKKNPRRAIEFVLKATKKNRFI